jgi:phage terminase Nu1 subunit (DNA packaging protein)
MIDLSAPITQAAFGDLIGVNQSEVSDYVRTGVLTRGAAAGTWLLEYCAHIRGIAAGRGGDDGIELTEQRARLAKEQADRIAMQNAVTRGELAPTILLEEVLAKSGARANKLFESIPGLLRRRCPFLAAAAIAEVAIVVNKVRGIAASMRLSDLDKDDDVEDFVEHSDGEQKDTTESP